LDITTITITVTSKTYALDVVTDLLGFSLMAYYSEAACSTAITGGGDLTFYDGESSYYQDPPSEQLKRILGYCPYYCLNLG
jgi:hypothetical protein